MILQETTENFLGGEHSRQWMPFVLVALVFSIPVSSTAKSILLSIVTPLILLMPECRERLSAFLKACWSKYAILFVLLALLGCLWSPAYWPEKLLVFQKYSKLLYMPVLAAGFVNVRLRNISLYSFLVAMGIVCGLSILKYMAVINYNGSDPGQIFQNHIMTGLLMSLAAYLSALFFAQGKGFNRFGWLLLALLFSCQILFIGTGRTGYVIYSLLMALLFVQVLSWKQAIGSILIGTLLIIFVFFNSSVMRLGLTSALNDINSYQYSNKNTSVGYRFQFHALAYNLFKTHPLIGSGTAGFTANFREKKPIPSWNRRLLEPHSQYWLIASEFGLFGLLIFLSFMGSLLMVCLRLPTMRPVGLAVLVAFFIGDFSDSLLFYSGTGYFFIVMIALALSESYKSTIITG